MAVGYIETWSAIFLLISLAGTGSRGYRVPLAELSNVLLLILMAGAVYTHRVLSDGQAYVPAALGAQRNRSIPKNGVPRFLPRRSLESCARRRLAAYPTGASWGRGPAKEGREGQDRMGGRSGGRRVSLLRALRITVAGGLLRESQREEMPAEYAGRVMLATDWSVLMLRGGTVGWPPAFPTFPAIYPPSHRHTPAEGEDFAEEEEAAEGADGDDQEAAEGGDAEEAEDGEKEPEPEAPADAGTGKQ